MPSGKQERMECHCTAGVALGWGWLEEDVVSDRVYSFSFLRTRAGEVIG